MRYRVTNQKTTSHTGTRDQVAFTGHCLVGGCLLSPELIETSRSLFEPGMILNEVDRKIYQVMVDLIDAGNSVDVYTVYMALDGDVIQKCGGHPYLFKLCDEGALILKSDIREACGVLREYDKQVRVQRVSELIAKDPNNEELRQKLTDEISGFTSKRNSLPEIGEQIDSYLQEKDEIAAGTIKALRTGIPLFDSRSGGVRKKKLLTVAGRPGTGKSAMMIQMASNFVGDGLRILYASAEMGFNEIMDRIVAVRQRVNVSELQTSAVKHHMGAVTNVCSSLYGSSFHLDDRGRIDVERLRKDVRRLRPDVIFVDFIQLISDTTNEETRAAQVGFVANEIKQIAMEFELLAVVASQLNREVEKRVNKRPTMADMKESGAIEEASDIVMLLWPREEGPDGDDIVCIIDKNRTGPRGQFHLRFVKRIMRFEEAEDVSWDK